ncbi:transposase [Gammaproteobacteria bacterium]
MNTADPQHSLLTSDQIDNLRSTAKNMYGANRRSFQAEITIQYCHGSARKAEKIFGWGRRTIKIGLAERKAGVVCVGAQPAFCGSKIWEERYPEAAGKLRELIETHFQPASELRSPATVPRLTSKKVLNRLSKLVPEEYLPSLSTMDNILIRMGYRIRKSKTHHPQQKIEETDRTFAAAENV